MLNSRVKKRFLIITFFLLIISVIIYFFYSVFSPDPSCSDDKRNQNEKDIDCGGVCSPCQDFSQIKNLVIEEKEFVFGGNNTYDGLIKLRNINDRVGSPVFSYNAKLMDKENNLIDQKNGKGFILPGETKYIVLMGFSVKEDQYPDRLEFEVNQVQWEEFIQYQKPQLSIYNKRFNLLSDMIGGEVYGVLKNESGFDFNLIKVNIVLRDEQNKLAALATTQMNTVRSGEERDFKLIWPYQILGQIKSIEVEAEADTYNSQNFIKTYIPEQKLPFQQY